MAAVPCGDGLGAGLSESALSLTQWQLFSDGVVRWHGTVGDSRMLFGDSTVTRMLARRGGLRDRDVLSAAGGQVRSGASVSLG